MPSDYHSRLAAMESWYEEFVGLEKREQLLVHDYAPHRSFLRSLTGSVIDVGGGAGLAARFLRPDVNYVVVDPADVWRSPEWVEFGRSFRGSGPEPEFVAAAGEALPFPDEHFDVALSFWSLNHVSDPRRCVAEMARVLKPGARARLVIEDVEPTWRDLIRDGAARVWARMAGSDREANIRQPLAKAFRLKAGGRWPLEEDHIRIAERDLVGWLGEQASIRRRQWLGGWLTIDLAKG